ncbi:MAG: HRDC domain-containing protein [Anaerolineae bacterium]
MEWPFPRAAYIEHDRDFRSLVKSLGKESLLAVDTESNSLYAYRERVCLVQLSTRTHDYIIDPLRIADLSPLATLLANPKIEKIFHAAEYDLMCLKRDYGFAIDNLFDTMVAARICGLKAIGLNRLLGQYLGIEADKSHQRDDWGQRPLSEEGLLYAQMDTHYLPQLRDKLVAELKSVGRMAEARETFADACEVPAANNTFDPDGYWRIGIPADLRRRQIAILREIYLLREQIAEERDCPPFKVFTDKMLIAVAESAPGYQGALEKVRGLPTSLAKRYGRPLLQAVERGRHAKLPQPPDRPPDIAPDVVERFTALRDWRRLRAEQRGVESDVIISRDTLWTLAQKAPDTLEDMHDIRGLGPWRLATYGEEILDVMRRLQMAE